MKNLLIIGARGFGREVFGISTQTKEYNNDWIIKGFLDDKVDALEGFNNYPSIISSVEDYEVQEDDLFICALGDVIYKKKYIKMILDKGGLFTNIIHPSSMIGLNSKIGNGVIICPFTYTYPPGPDVRFKFTPSLGPTSLVFTIPISKILFL